MNRLTKKDTLRDNGYAIKNLSYETTIAVNDKLGQLEDIEEELGIDLITYLRLVIVHKNNSLNYIYDKKNNDYEKIKGWDFFDEMKLSYGSENYYFKDYGKTWALSKEELEENEKKN